MKTFLESAGILFIFLLIIVCLFNLFGETVSSNELENTLSASMEHALYTTMQKNNYQIQSEEQLAADLCHELMASSTVEADYTIEFLQIDMENGLLDMKVTQKTHAAKFVNTTVSCRKTLILERDAS